MTTTVVATQNPPQVFVVAVEPRGRAPDAIPLPAEAVENLVLASYLAGEVLNGHRAVYVDSDGLVYKASNTQINQAVRVAGIVKNSYAPTQPTQIIRNGVIEEPSWTWAEGLPIFLGNDGLLTQTPPSAPGAVYSLVVGYPITSTSMYVNIQEPTLLA